MSPSETDRTLLVRARNGCQDSARLLIEKYSATVHRVICRHLDVRVRTLLDPVDVLQSVWCAVFCHETVPPQVFESRETFPKLLFGLARNETRMVNRKYLRAEKRSLTRRASLVSDLADQRPSAEQVALTMDEWCSFLKSLPCEWQAAVRLLRDGYSQAEVTEQLCIPKRTFERFLAGIRGGQNPEAGV
jgi:hypothetical protein